MFDYRPRAYNSGQSSEQLMSLTPGARLGPYEILAAIGAGGMGEVYKARDTRLNRDVAIKILPEHFAADADRVARFQREAQVLASLNHPHIAAIYGLEEAPSTASTGSGQAHSAGSGQASSGQAVVRALVLELVDGLTLSEVIAMAVDHAPSGSEARQAVTALSPERRGWGPGAVREVGPHGKVRKAGLSLDEALPIARQIAEALEAAHEHGIIHRDLKPANIKLTADGSVKVLDFGLAKLAQASDSGLQAPGLSNSPTLTSPAMATNAGIILGTAAYMSPEQAKGKPVDKRGDIWAFGCVLYEMLTGKRAFEGDDVSDTMAAILRGEPDWNALPGDVPPHVRTLLRSCLEKDRKVRMGDVSVARFLLDQGAALTAAGASTVSRGAARRKPVWGRAIPIAITAVVAGALAAIAGFYAKPSPAPPRVSRLAVSLPNAAPLTIDGILPDIAITPDGTRLVYVGSNGAQMFVRALDALEPVAIFKGAPRGPFVSPDGQWVGFFDGTSALKKVAITGGPAVPIAAIDPGPRGATWAPDDTIIFATANAGTGLQRVPAGGGTPTVLTRPEHARGEADHLWPEMLPGGRAVLFTITAQGGGLDAAQVAVLDLQTGARKVLVRGGSHAHYAASGHLVYAAAGTLRAIAFDPVRLETSGTPVPVVPDVVTTTFGGVDAVVDGHGTLAYVTGGTAALQRTLTWVDRQGRETPVAAPPRAYVSPRIAPDGTRVAVSAGDEQSDIWIWDLARATLTRATLDPATDTYPVWTPDGRRLIFSSERMGARNLFWQEANGTGTVERLTDSPNQQDATAVSPDGKQLIFHESTPTPTGRDIMQVDLDGAHRVTPLVRTPFTEENGIISPDGRWLAYEANDSGRLEVYVRPYPDVNVGRWQVSTGGGNRPLWARNGRELFYLSPSGSLMSVTVENGPTWTASVPTMLLKQSLFVSSPGATVGRTYDVSADGQRFLMIKQGTSEQTAAPPQIIVVQNWVEELKRLVPVSK